MDTHIPLGTQAEIERKLRVDLAACFRITALNGWDDAIYTHFSLRIPGSENHFLINPWGLFFEEITASNLVKIDVNGNKIESSPYSILPAAFIIHSALHMSRADAQCVLHLHTLDGMAVAAMECGVLPISSPGMAVNGDIAVLPYDRLPADHTERLRIQAALSDKHLLLMKNHGTLAIGKTVAEAFHRIRFLEQACSVQVRAMAGVGQNGLAMPGPGLTEQVVALMRNQTPYAANELLWPALIRRLDRMCPDYKD